MTIKEHMKKRSVTIAGHATSITLEEEFWAELKRIAKQEHKSINALITDIDQARENANLSSAIRVYILKKLKS